MGYISGTKNTAKRRLKLPLSRFNLCKLKITLMCWSKCSARIPPGSPRVREKACDKKGRGTGKCDFIVIIKGIEMVQGQI